LSNEIKQQITEAVTAHKNDVEFKEMLGATIKDPKFSSYLELANLL
jgi:hypothetical protein